MALFKSALTSWLASHPEHSARSVSEAAEISQSVFIQYKNGGREITFEALCKLVPVIERMSNREAAVSLIIAYLFDKTPQTHAAHIKIESVDAEGQPAPDAYRALAQAWEDRARREPGFFDMWQGMEFYMTSPEKLLGEQQQTTTTNPSDDGSVTYSVSVDDDDEQQPPNAFGRSA